MDLLTALAPGVFTTLTYSGDTGTTLTLAAITATLILTRTKTLPDWTCAVIVVTTGVILGFLSLSASLHLLSTSILHLFVLWASGSFPPLAACLALSLLLPPSSPTHTPALVLGHALAPFPGLVLSFWAYLSLLPTPEFACAALIPSALAYYAAAHRAGPHLPPRALSLLAILTVAAPPGAYLALLGSAVSPLSLATLTALPASGILLGSSLAPLRAAMLNQQGKKSNPGNVLFGSHPNGSGWGRWSTARLGSVLVTAGIATTLVTLQIVVKGYGRFFSLPQPGLSLALIVASQGAMVLLLLPTLAGLGVFGSLPLPPHSAANLSRFLYASAAMTAVGLGAALIDPVFTTLALASSWYALYVRSASFRSDLHRVGHSVGAVLALTTALHALSGNIIGPISLTFAVFSTPFWALLLVLELFVSVCIVSLGRVQTPPHALGLAVALAWFETVLHSGQAGDPLSIGLFYPAPYVLLSSALGLVFATVPQGIVLLGPLKIPWMVLFACKPVMLWDPHAVIPTMFFISLYLFRRSSSPSSFTPTASLLFNLAMSGAAIHAAQYLPFAPHQKTAVGFLAWLISVAPSSGPSSLSLPPYSSLIQGAHTTGVVAVLSFLLLSPPLPTLDDPTGPLDALVSALTHTPPVTALLRPTMESSPWPRWAVWVGVVTVSSAMAFHPSSIHGFLVLGGMSIGLGVGGLAFPPVPELLLLCSLLGALYAMAVSFLRFPSSTGTGLVLVSGSVASLVQPVAWFVLHSHLSRLPLFLQSGPLATFGSSFVGAASGLHLAFAILLRAYDSDLVRIATVTGQTRLYAGIGVLANVAVVVASASLAWLSLVYLSAPIWLVGLVASPLLVLLSLPETWVRTHGVVAATLSVFLLADMVSTLGWSITVLDAARASVAFLFHFRFVVPSAFPRPSSRGGPSSLYSLILLLSNLVGLLSSSPSILLASFVAFLYEGVAFFSR